MALANGKITAPVSVDDVKSVLGESSNDLATLCKSANINKWAKYKPMSIAKPFNITERDRANCHYGLDFTTNSLLTKEFRRGSSFSLSTYSLTNVLDAASEWTYSRPRGSSSSPYRLGDFVNNETLTDGYSAKTSAPLGGFSNGVIGLDSYKTRTISTSPGKTDSSALNVSLEGTSLLYTSFKCRWAGSDLYSQSWQALGMVGSDVIPINNILDINNGYYRLGLVVRGVSNWYLCVSSSTFKEVNANTERQTLAPRWICPNLMSNTRLIDEVLEHMNSHEEYYATAVPCIVKNAIISVSGLICTTKLQSDGEIYCVPEGKVNFALQIKKTAAYTVHFTVAVYVTKQMINVGNGESWNNYPVEGFDIVFDGNGVLTQDYTVEALISFTYQSGVKERKQVSNYKVTGSMKKGSAAGTRVHSDNPPSYPAVGSIVVQRITWK